MDPSIVEDSGHLLNEDERKIAENFAEEMEKLFAGNDVGVTVSLGTKLESVLLSYLLVYKLEKMILEHGPFTGEDENGQKSLHPVVDAATKAREKWGNTMNELDGSFAEKVEKSDSNLPDKMKLLLEKNLHILQNALEEDEEQTENGDREE